MRPDYVTHAGDDRLFVVEQPGRIRIIQGGQLLDRPFLDIADKVTTDGNEQGLLSVAFHPDYQTNGQFFVNYTRQKDGATVIERYTVSKDDPDRADDQSGKVILVIDQPEANHNGGLIKFGPDGYLYIGMGDGGGAGDRHGSIGNGQDRNSLLGKMLRIDVTNQDTYAVPSDNPFGNEIWAYGLRNPWRFSFDRSTGDLYLADVGQNAYEEVNSSRPRARAARITAGASWKDCIALIRKRAAIRRGWCCRSRSTVTPKAAVRSRAATCIADRNIRRCKVRTFSAITAPATSGRCSARAIGGR